MIKEKIEKYNKKILTITLVVSVIILTLFLSYKFSNNETTIQNIQTEQIEREEKDELPEIILNGANEIYLEYPNLYIEPGYMAKDRIEGDITFKVEKTGAVDRLILGEYVINYKVANNSGKIAEIQRKITVQDTIAPEINLIGDAYISINQGEIYTELGATAKDNYDGDVTKKIKIESNIDSQVLGKQYINYYVEDSSGNKQTAQKTLEVKKTSQISEIPNIPEISELITKIEYSTTNPTNNAVTVTITANKRIQCLTEGYLSIENICTKAYEYNKDEAVEIHDEYGNIINISISIKNIDKIIPVGIVTYSIETPTNQDIIATIELDKDVLEIPGWTKINNKVFEKFYTENIADELVSFADLSGNTGSVIIEIANINKIPLEINIKYSTTKPINTSVLVTIVSNKSINIQGWNSKSKTYTKLYNENTEEILKLTDIYGNSTIAVIKINNIDKLPINAKIEYSTEDITMENITVIITTDKEIRELFDWTKITDTEYSKVYTTNTNGDEIVEIEDLSGNKINVIINISNIDRIELETSVKYSSKTLTNTDVIVTIISNKNILEILEWTKISDFEYQKTYTENHKESIVVFDKLGRSSTVLINVNNIDKTPIDSIISYSETKLTNKNIDVTIKFNKKVNMIEDWEQISDNTYMKNYSTNIENEKVSFSDLAGNSDYVTINIQNIDKQKPTYTLVYTPYTQTSEDVLVTITANKKIKMLDHSWNVVDNIATKIYTENTEQTLTMEDYYTNKENVSIKIDFIEKELPTEAIEANIEYNITNITNEDVRVTITSNKTVTIPEFECENKVCIKTYSENIEEEVVLTDLFGNRKKVLIHIDWIDKEKPKAIITYSTINPINTNVTVRLTMNKTINHIVGFTTVDGINYFKTYNENITNEIINFVDLAGNKGDAIVEILNINKEIPTYTVKYNPEIKTKSDVIAIITANKNINIEDNSWINTDNVAEKKYNNNTNEQVSIKDIYGNSTNIEININWIDKTGPVIDINNSNPLYVEAKTEYIEYGATANDYIDGEVETKISGNVNINKTGIYYITYMAQDLSGNTTSVSRQVIVRDTTIPVITVENDNAQIFIEESFDLLDGVTAIDNYDGDISERIKITSTPEFDVDTEGIYTIKYNVTDFSGNVASEKIKTITNINNNISKIIATGSNHTYMVSLTGEAYGWGNNVNNQLGIGEKSIPTIIESFPSKVIAIDGGTSHSIALLENGDVYTWGSGAQGQLGLGVGIYSKNIPTKIILPEKAKDITAGSMHTLVLLENGDVYAWGINQYGSLGVGENDNTSRYTPTKVALTEAAKDVSAGHNHSMAILENGEIYSWGLNNSGQLGNGNVETYVTIPKRIEGIPTKAISIDSGENHNIALLENGDVYTWGNNSVGQLGTGNTNMSRIPIKVDLGEKADEIGIGNKQSFAIINGALYVWGNNNLGQLGIGNTTNQMTPIKNTKLKQNITGVKSGDTHTIIIDTNRNMYVFGNNSNGQLGDASSDSTDIPVKVKK